MPYQILQDIFRRSIITLNRGESDGRTDETSVMEVEE
jgi:hypothetical protein